MAKALDLTGQRFGNLVVIERAENNKRGNTQWLCRCDCGNEKVALGSDLNRGRTTTCGCSLNKKGKPSKNRKNLVGQKFGKLTVISLNEEESKNGILIWNCKCECGNLFKARGGNLKNGKAKHCGCSKSEFPNNFKDLTGQRYGRLVVIGLKHHSYKKIQWLCKCDCGNETVVTTGNLKRGNVKSCGCYKREISTEIIKRVRPNKEQIYRTHGMTGTKLYAHWSSMHNRCKPYYHDRNSYYDRGIKVCDEWKSFEPFRDWALANGYDDSLTLDRIDYNGNYAPNNCRWVDWKTQQNNKRNNVYITIDEETKTLKQWSEYYGLDYGMVRARWRKGWTIPKLFEPKHEEYSRR